MDFGDERGLEIMKRSISKLNTQQSNYQQSVPIEIVRRICVFINRQLPSRSIPLDCQRRHISRHRLAATITDECSGATEKQFEAIFPRYRELLLHCQGTDCREIALLGSPLGWDEDKLIAHNNARND